MEMACKEGSPASEARPEIPAIPVVSLAREPVIGIEGWPPTHRDTTAMNGAQFSGVAYGRIEADAWAPCRFSAGLITDLCLSHDAL